MGMLDQLRRLLRPLEERIKGLVARGTVHKVGDGGLAQVVQVELLRGELLDGVEVWWPYGLTAHPLVGPDVEALVVFVGADRSHAVCLGVMDRRHRPKLPEGASALHDHTGQFVRVDPDGDVHVSAHQRHLVTAPQTEVSGNHQVGVNAQVGGSLQVGGSATVGGQVQAAGLTTEGDVAAGGSLSDATGTMAQIRQIYNSHTHPGGGPPSPQM